jgi:hypothetical protein
MTRFSDVCVETVEFFIDVNFSGKYGDFLFEAAWVEWLRQVGDPCQDSAP